MRGGIDLEGHRFRPRFVKVIDVSKVFLSGDGTLSSPCDALFFEPKVGVSTSCGAMSTRGTIVVVPVFFWVVDMYNNF